MMAKAFVRGPFHYFFGAPRKRTSENVYIFFQAGALHLLYPEYSPTPLLAADVLRKKHLHKQNAFSRITAVLYGYFFSLFITCLFDSIYAII